MPFQRTPIHPLVRSLVSTAAAGVCLFLVAGGAGCARNLEDVAARKSDFSDQRPLDPRISHDVKDLRVLGFSNQPYTGMPDYLTPMPRPHPMEEAPLVTGEAAPIVLTAPPAPVAARGPTPVQKRLAKFDELVTKVESHPPVTAQDIVALKRAAADVGGELPEDPALYQTAEQMETTISALHASSDPRDLLQRLLALSTQIRLAL